MPKVSSRWACSLRTSVSFKYRVARGGLTANLLVAIVIGCVSPESKAVAASLTGLQVFGDSLSDEYFDQGIGYARNWVQLLVEQRGVNVGRRTFHFDVRLTGYAFNWAVAGATSTDLVQNIDLISGWQTQIQQGLVSHAVLAIGANDFYPSSPAAYGRIYAGTWSAAQIDTYVNNVLSNIQTLATTLTSTGIPLVLATVPDYGVAPMTRNNFPNGAGREAVAAVIAGLNAELVQFAQAQNIPVVDIYGLARDTFGPHTSPNSTLAVGGVDINLLGAGTSATNGFVADGIHIHTVFQGILANLFVAGLNQGYDLGLVPFSEQELLAHASLTYTGVDTLPLNVDDYVILAVVPEPATHLLALSGAVLCWGAVRRTRRRTCPIPPPTA